MCTSPGMFDGNILPFFKISPMYIPRFSLSQSYIFFSPFDPFPIPHQKWKDFIGDDYNCFWDIFDDSNQFNKKLEDQDYVKLDAYLELFLFLIVRKSIFTLRNANLMTKWFL